jgi:hypothetical protein
MKTLEDLSRPYPRRAVRALETAPIHIGIFTIFPRILKARRQSKRC